MITIDTTQYDAEQAANKLFADELKAGFTITGVYPYELVGKVVFWTVLFFDPKTARPRKEFMYRDEQGNFVSGMPKFEKGTRPLFGLPKILSFDPGVPVWFFSTEKPAVQCMGKGIPAAADADLSSLSQSNYSELTGKTIVLALEDRSADQTVTKVLAKRFGELKCRILICLEEDVKQLETLLGKPDFKQEDLASVRLAELPTEPKDTRNIYSDEDGQTLEIICMKDIEAKPISWLVDKRIALGKQTMVAGHPGLGKSTLAIHLAATVTIGGMWQGSTVPCPQGHVFILTSEDDGADTVKPRLLAAGADINFCHIIKAPTFTLDRSLGLLNAAIKAHGGKIQLIIIDPIAAFMGKADSNNNSDVRACLFQLSELASVHGFAVLCVSHLNKNAGGEALMRVTGSLAFVAAVRAAYFVTKDPDDNDRRLFLPLKNNLAKDKIGYAYTIKECIVGDGIDTSKIVWELGPIIETVDEIMERLKESKPGKALEAAEKFLMAFLAKGPMEAEEIFKVSRIEGHSDKTLNRAKKKIGIEPYKGHGKGAPWHWKLPPIPKAQDEDKDGQDGQGGQDAQVLAFRNTQGKATTPPANSVADPQDAQQDAHLPTHLGNLGILGKKATLAASTASTPDVAADKGQNAVQGAQVGQGGQDGPEGALGHVFRAEPEFKAGQDAQDGQGAQDAQDGHDGEGSIDDQVTGWEEGEP